MSTRTTKLNTHVSAPHLFEGTWRVALVEADIVFTKSRTDTIYPYSDICRESIVKGERRPLLHRLSSTSVGNWMTVVDMPFYVPKKNK
jgi:hypothetical protein